MSHRRSDETETASNVLPGRPSIRTRGETSQSFKISVGSFSLDLSNMMPEQQVSPDLTNTNQSNMQYSYPPQPVSSIRLASNEHPPTGSELNSSLLAPSPYFAPNLLGMGSPNQNTSYAPQPGMLPSTYFVRNPGLQQSVSNSSFVSNPAMNRPDANPSFVHNPVRQLPIPRPGVTSDSDPSFVRNSSVPTRATYPSFFLSNHGMPSYFVPNFNMQPPAPNPAFSGISCPCQPPDLHHQFRNPTPPVQPTATFSHPSYAIPTSFSCPPPVSNWQHMPYPGPVPLHHPGNLNPMTPYQAGYFPAEYYYPPCYVTYVSIYPRYTDSTITTSARNFYQSESDPNPWEQNSNPSGPNRTYRS